MAAKKNSTVTFFESDTSTGLEHMINDFFKDGTLEIINVSYQTCYDHSRQYILHSAAIAYTSFEDVK